ncbi:AAA family ATPase [Clostridium sp. AWRP]|uniref:AAA family ATPase n=1 Tax=Clostridium sp. AWRP TaxID=2212991 RepID=UPI000FD864D2|nr:AAA family ATPase [Clostridium sp. AWRP]AZV56374.1 AAA family ATPase [Clostridium sp. AWRP]
MEKNNTFKFKRDLSSLLKARFPYIYIPTWEEDRILSVIRDVVKDKEIIRTTRQIFTWSLTSGIIGENEKGSEDTKAPIKALEFIEKYSEASVFVLKDFHVFFGVNGRNQDNEIVRKIRDISSSIKQNPKPKNVLFVCPSLVLPTDLQKDISILEFNLPNADEIKSLLNEMIEVNGSGRIKINLNEDEKERLSKAALGLTLQEAENSFARAMAQDGTLDSNDIDLILDEKCQVIKKTGILEFVKSNLKIEDVGGLQNLKKWLMKRNKSWLDSAKKYGLPAPKGVLITGVPGCGKSLIAKSISAMWQLPLLRLDMGRIFSGIVGSSEENMRKAIRTAEAVSPSILWIDEIEKGMRGQNSGDSGTTTRIFGTFLTWMQEKTEPVFVVATANNISQLPAELLRKGRFDEIFFVDLPTFNERKDIFKVHINKRLRDDFVRGNFQLNDDVLNKFSNMTEGFVGSEIEQVVISALYEAYFEDRSIKLEDFEKSITNTVPLVVTQAEQIRAIREWANIRAVAATPKEDRADYKSRESNIYPDFKEKRTSPEDIKSSRGGRAIDF